MNRKINLCFVVNNFDVGGLEKVVIDLINNLDREKFTVFFICLDGEGDLLKRISGIAPPHLILKKKTHYNLSFIWKIQRFIKEHNIEIIHAHNLSPLIYSGMAVKSMIRKGPVVIFTEHNQVYRLDYVHEFRFKYFYVHLANCIVTCSEDLRRYYQRHLGVVKNTRVIHNGIEGMDYVGSLKKIRKKYGVEEDAFVVGNAVIISEQKGIAYLIKAAQKISSTDRNIHFLIAGDGPLRKELEGQVKEYHLKETVQFLGHVDNVEELISIIDVYVLPSLWEGLPLALLEALSMGKPIIATSVGGNPEIIEDGINGFLIPPKDSDALVDAILKLYAERENGFEAISKENYTKFKRKFSLERMVGNYTVLYCSQLPRQ